MAAPYMNAGGQTKIPPEDNTNIPFVPFEKCEIPDFPIMDVRPDLKDKWIMTCDSVWYVPDVTPEMMDWFWCNMEKCYYLWAPGAHKEFRWVNPPWKVGFVGAAHTFTEQEDENSKELKIIDEEHAAINLGMEEFVFEDCWDHVEMGGTPGVFINAYMWKAAPQGGLYCRQCAAANKEMSQFFPIPLDLNHKIELNELQHPEYEAARFPKFLPQLYNVWKDHPDPSQNVMFNLSVKKVGDYKWEYVYENGPV